MHIGILQCGHTSGEVAAHHGDFDTMFEGLFDGHGLTFSSYDIENMVFPPSVTTCDGWLLTGSKHGAYEDHPFIPPLEAFIRDAYAAGVPQVGICFGHQIMAQAMGGKVVKYDGGWGIGRAVYRMGDRDIALNALHQDQVVTRPEAARVLASSDFCENAALVYGDRMLSLQPHPEFSPQVIETYIKMRRGLAGHDPDRMDAAVVALDQPIDQAPAATMISAFFKDAHNG